MYCENLSDLHRHKIQKFTPHIMLSTKSSLHVVSNGTKRAYPNILCWSCPLCDKPMCINALLYVSGYMWTLVFSTLQHGFSLNSMYRKMSKIESPILLVIQDTQNNVSRKTLSRQRWN